MSGHFRFFILPSIVTNKIGFLNLRVAFQLPICCIIITITPFFSEKKKNEGKNGIELKKRTQLQKFDEGLLCALSLKYDVVNATPLKCTYVILKVITVSLWLQIGVEGRERRPLLYRHCVEPTLASRLQSIWLCGDFGCRYKRPEPIAFLSRPCN